jgi:hypothetical protein
VREKLGNLNLTLIEPESKRVAISTEQEQEQGAGAGAKISPPPSPELTDEEWYESLKLNPAYQGIDIDAVRLKMDGWCNDHDTQPTRTKLLKWLEKEEKPFKGRAPDKKATRYNQDKDPWEGINSEADL